MTGRLMKILNEIIKLVRIGTLVTILLQWNIVTAQSRQHTNMITVENDSELVTLLSPETVDPFSKEAQIRFQLKETVHVDVRITTVNGKTVRQLLSAELADGIHSITWDGKDENAQPARSGVFVYEIQTQQITRSATLALLY
jgi:flagellar hook assembly protein FlgD